MFGSIAMLAAAIGVEVAATSALPRTDGFRHPLWSGAVLLGYAASIWLLSMVVRRLPVSTVYAVWSGAGTVAIACIGALFLGERLNVVSVVAIVLIVVGVVVLNLQGAH